MAFTANDVKTLREMTGAGMMDCKKALSETDGNMDRAVEVLREKGLAAAAKKAGRIAAEGIVYANVYGSGVAVAIEVNSETDFVAKNADFQKFVMDLASVVESDDPADVDDLMTKPYPRSEFTVADILREKILVIGENLKIRRFERYDADMSVAYVHANGRIGVIVNMKVSDNLKGNDEVVEIGRDLAMQITAMRPQWLDKSQVSDAVLEEERKVLMAQALNEGKPQNVAEKMVNGRINKYYEEFCLMQQAFVKADKQTVAEYVKEKAKELGGEISVLKFTRFEKGEGLEKREDNFAEEVAGMIK